MEGAAKLWKFSCENYWLLMVKSCWALKTKIESEQESWRKSCAKRLYECDNSCYGSSLIFSSENF